MDIQECLASQGRLVIQELLDRAELQAYQEQAENLGTLDSLVSPGSLDSAEHPASPEHPERAVPLVTQATPEYPDSAELQARVVFLALVSPDFLVPLGIQGSVATQAYPALAGLVDCREHLVQAELVEHQENQDIVASQESLDTLVLAEFLDLVDTLEPQAIADSPVLQAQVGYPVLGYLGYLVRLDILEYPDSQESLDSAE